MISTKKIFNKVLVANRGEIAVRIMRTLRGLGISTVAIYTGIEKNALHVILADEGYELSGISLSETYLDINKIISIAVHSGCDAIHPGYGFLSENPSFAEAVTNAGINFIGPPADIIKIMGNKVIARNLVGGINVPVSIGFEGTAGELISNSAKLSYPLLLKAAAGGGGKAMRIVNSAPELKSNLESVAREAINYFGDDSLYAEKYFHNARHIEIQVIADHYGDILILGERDCSVQRRYQKVIEESPSSFITDETREKLFNTTRGIIKNISYVNAGTIEFLVNENQEFFFLEMNTRIQVEHGVTEMITGLDIVELQVYVAAGNPLGIGQYDIRSGGHAIEARIYAEDPANNFSPSPGPVYIYNEPSLPGLRIDSSLKGESYILPEYDPMIAKVIFYGSSRDEAIMGLRKALSEFVILGTKTNREFLIELLDNNEFLANRISINFLERETLKINQYLSELKESIGTVKILAAWLGCIFFGVPGISDFSIWEYIGEWRHLLRKSVSFRGKQFDIMISLVNERKLVFRIDENEYELAFKSRDEKGIIFEFEGDWSFTSVVTGKSSADIVFIDGYEFELYPMDFLAESPLINEENPGGVEGPKIIRSPFHGKIIKISVEESSMVKEGDILCILDAMKIENKIHSPVNGCIKEIRISESEQVEIHQQLFIIDSCM